MGHRSIAMLVMILMVLGPTLVLSTEHQQQQQNADITLVNNPPASVVDVAAFDLASVSGSYFIENVGQLENPEVRFYTQGSPLSIGLTSWGAIFTIVGDGPRMVVFNLRFQTSNDIDPVGIKRLEHRSNFFLGNDVGRWTRGVSHFREVVFPDLYNGVDVRYYFQNGVFKYDVMVDVGVDPGCVSYRFEGVEGLEVEPTTGDLLIHTPLGDVRDTRPIVIQEGQGSDGMLDGDFVIADDDTVAFEVPSVCSRSLPLIIDPSLHFSTYLGGTKTERGCSVAVDPAGNVFVAGPTTSGNFPVTTGAYDVTFDGYDTMVFDAFVAKFDPTGSDLLACTFVGGDGSDEAHEIEVDQEGSVYLAGTTTSSDFPLSQDALNTTGGIYLVKLSSDLASLHYATFIPGVASIVEIILAPNGAAYIFGNTYTDELPTTAGAYCETFPGNSTPYVMRLDSTLKSITYCSYIGPGTLNGAFLDPSGSVYLAGLTLNASFPLTDGAYNSTIVPGVASAFALKLNLAGSDLVFSTVLGEGASADIVATSTGRSVVVGGAYSDFLLTSNALRDTFEETEGFIAVLDSNGASVSFSSFVGGDGADVVNSVAWDGSRDIVYISGTSTSTDLPMPPGGFDQEYRGNLDMPNAFILGYNVSSPAVTFGTYIGGNKGEEVVHNGMVLVDDRYLYLAGRTWADNFPTTDGAYDTTYNGGFIEITDAFVTMFDPTFRSPPPMPANIEIESFDEELLLKWDPYDIGNGRIFKHRVYRGLAEGQEVFYDETTNLGGYTDLNVVNGVNYYYRVNAVNSVGASPLSPSIKGMPIGPPSEPLSITATSGNGTVTLNWTPPETDGGSPVQGYHVYKGVLSTSVSHYRTLGNVTGFFDGADDLDLGLFYFYWVQAYNVRGNGTLSQYIRIKPTAPPTPPQDFEVVPGDGKAVLSWSQPFSFGGTQLLGYHIWQVALSGTPTLVATVGPLALDLVDDNVSNGVPYVYYVTVFTEVGESLPSVSIDVIPFGPPDVPLALEAIAEAQLVSLTWDPPGFDGGRQVTKYVIGWGTSDTNLDMTFTIGNVTSFEHTGLTNGVTYFYQVQAHNEAGSGLMTTVVQATPMGLPSEVMGFQGVSVVEGIKLTWEAPADTGGDESLTYRLLKGLDDDPQEVLIELEDIFEFIDTDVEGRSVYHYRILAINSKDVGPSSEVLIVTVLTQPAKVTDVLAIVSSGQVSLTWTPPDDGGSSVSSYVILRGLFETGMAEVGNADGTAGNYTDGTAEIGSTYFYQVYAINGIGAGPRSDSVSVTLLEPPSPPGILETKVKDDVVVLTWVAPITGGQAPVTGYKLFRGTASDGLTLLAELGPVLTYTDEDVEKGTTYYYRVVATSDSGDGEPTSVSSVEVKKSEEGPGFGSIIAISALVMGLLLITRRRSRD